MSIGRALLKNVPVLVFDGSTSALDVNTEKKLLETVKREYALLAVQEISITFVNSRLMAKKGLYYTLNQ